MTCRHKLYPYRVLFFPSAGCSFIMSCVMKKFSPGKYFKTLTSVETEQSAQLKRYFLTFFISIQAVFLLYFTVYNITAGEYDLAMLEAAGLALAVFFLLVLVLRKRFYPSLAVVYLLVCMAWTYSTYMIKLHDYILIFSIFISLSSFYLLGSRAGAVYTLLYAIGLLMVIQLSRSAHVFVFKEYLNFFGGYLIINLMVLFYQRNYETASNHLVKLNNDLKVLSVKDPLTNLYNRRYFYEMFDREDRRTRRLQCFMGLAILDLDHFKLYNDQYGHPAGDELLQRFAGILQKSFSRSTDYVFRLGGEEFGIILSDSDSRSIVSSLDRFKQVLHKAAFLHEQNNPSNRVTFSGGLVLAKPEERISTEEMYKKADNLLYLAKEAGRDTVKHTVV